MKFDTISFCQSAYSLEISSSNLEIIKQYAAKMKEICICKKLTYRENALGGGKVIFEKFDGFNQNKVGVYEENLNFIVLKDGWEPFGFSQAYQGPIVYYYKKEIE